VRKAKAGDISDYIIHGLERREERLREGRTALYALISISSILEAYINSIAVISGKGDTGRD
jgi:hypothetical protein